MVVIDRIVIELHKKVKSLRSFSSTIMQPPNPPSLIPDSRSPILLFQ